MGDVKCPISFSSYVKEHEIVVGEQDKLSHYKRELLVLFAMKWMSKVRIARAQWEMLCREIAVYGAKSVLQQRCRRLQWLSLLLLPWIRVDAVAA